MWILFDFSKKNYLASSRITIELWLRRTLVRPVMLLSYAEVSARLITIRINNRVQLPFVNTIFFLPATNRIVDF
jgi:hypothetical protein